METTRHERGKSRKKVPKKRISFVFPAIVCALLMIVGGVVYAKYVQSNRFEGKITVSAQLVESLELYEHEAVRQADGSYVLDGAKKASDNSYLLIPGLDIPKDPQISITGKSSIESYLYLEVLDQMDEENTKVYYELTDVWMPLKQTADPTKYLTGPNGGIIYVYSSDGTTATRLDHTFDTDGSGIIRILKNDKITVSDQLNRVHTEFALTFSAEMIQALEDKSAAAVYETRYPIS